LGAQLKILANPLSNVSENTNRLTSKNLKSIFENISAMTSNNYLAKALITK
jgi:hypothetical protein